MQALGHGREDKGREPNSRYINYEDADETIPDDFNDAYDDEYRNEKMDEEDEPMDEEYEQMDDEDNMVDDPDDELDIPKDKKSVLRNEDKSFSNPKAG